MLSINQYLEEGLSQLKKAVRALSKDNPGYRSWKHYPTAEGIKGAGKGLKKFAGTAAKFYRPDQPGGKFVQRRMGDVAKAHKYYTKGKGSEKIQSAMGTADKFVKSLRKKENK